MAGEGSESFSSLPQVGVVGRRLSVLPTAHCQDSIAKPKCARRRAHATKYAELQLRSAYRDLGRCVPSNPGAVPTMNVPEGHVAAVHAGSPFCIHFARSR